MPLNLDLALTNDQVFEFIQQKPAIVPLANQVDNRPSIGSGLTTINGVANQEALKSPIHVKLETMIETLAMFRQEMDG